MDGCLDEYWVDGQMGGVCTYGWIDNGYWVGKWVGDGWMNVWLNGYRMDNKWTGSCWKMGGWMDR